MGKSGRMMEFYPISRPEATKTVAGVGDPRSFARLKLPVPR